MSVGIVSDEMHKIPSSCSRCGFTFMYGPEPICAGYLCRVDNETDYPRPDWCPLQEVEPVRHGRWNDATVHNGELYNKCSECGYLTPFSTPSRFLYCPHCGAKMDGETE